MGVTGQIPVIEVYLERDDPELPLLISSDLEGVPVRTLVTGPYTAY